LPHAFLQSIVCRSAVRCLKSRRAALLLQDTRQKDAFAHTHTLIVACTSPICLLYWLGTCVNFIPSSEGSVALFLSVVCPMLVVQSIVCRSAVHCLKSRRAVLLSQDKWREGAFTRTHTSIVACTSPIHLLYWLGTCVNFIPNREGSIALFLSVVCPCFFCNR
jgi:hypothetical protein